MELSNRKSRFRSATMMPAAPRETVVISAQQPAHVRAHPRNPDGCEIALANCASQRITVTSLNQPSTRAQTLVETSADRMSGCTEATACSGDQVHVHPSLADRCTVVLITSPTIIHPDTYMLEEVACSLVLAPGLDACPKIIVADGFKV